jgi:hypothetical protein
MIVRVNGVEVGAGTDPDELREREMTMDGTTGTTGPSERERAVQALGRARVIDGLAWAWASARGQTLSSYDPDTGHNQAWVGFNAFTVLTDRLDRVFSLGRFALPGGLGSATGADLVAQGLNSGEFERMPVIERGVVLRDDVNGSPGWRHGRWRILLQSYGGQDVDRIPWPQKSPTKQLVAQPISSSQLALPLGVLTLPGPLDDAELFGPAAGGGAGPGSWPAEGGPVVNLVAAYAIDAVTERSALHLGHPQLNRGGGQAWAWRIALDVDGVSETPAAGLALGGPAADAGERPAVPDAPVRLRPAAAESRTGTEGRR